MTLDLVRSLFSKFHSLCCCVAQYYCLLSSSSNPLLDSNGFDLTYIWHLLWDRHGEWGAHLKLRFLVRGLDMVMSGAGLYGTMNSQSPSPGWDWDCQVYICSIKFKEGGKSENGKEKCSNRCHNLQDEAARERNSYGAITMKYYHRESH